MINLKNSIDAIELLISEDSAASLTYAALECRLAIEFICYERLRVAHGYISHEDLRRWQPKDIVNMLIQEVDTNIASTYTFSISKEPTSENQPSASQADYEAIEYVPIGTQIGFNPKKLGSLWHALSGVALHTRIPTNKSDTVSHYGDPHKIKAKVTEALNEIKRIGTGTLLSTGIGEEVSFECSCGTKNKRRLGLLQNGQTISCINPECTESFDFQKDNLLFKRRVQTITCQNCEAEHKFAQKELEKLKVGSIGSFMCEHCSDKVLLQWRIHQGQTPQKVNNPD